jgi:hypothetical protein
MRASGNDRDVFARTRRHASDKVAFVSGSLKLIRRFGPDESGDEDELYDLAADPYEHDSRAEDGGPALAAMRAGLDEFLRREAPVAGTATRDVELSPQVTDHLRALGYVE